MNNSITTKKLINDLAYQIVNCSIEVHKQLGPGLLESVYQKCLKEEFNYRNIGYVEQLKVPIKYRELTLDADLRLDFLVEDLIVVEIKAIEGLLPLHEAQILSYMQLLQKPKGLLINFHTLNVVKGMKPLVNHFFSALPE
jgi:GxxExxY protein